MKIRSLAALALFSAAPAFAQSVWVDFETVLGYVNPVLEAYNGGTDSLGQSGANVGVSFSSGAVALANDELGPYYLNAPSPLAVMYAADSSALMNVAGGFVDTFTFSYSSNAAAADGVNIYAGLNGTGALLGSISLAANAQNGCTTANFCHFDQLSFAFAGVAQSVTFAGNSPNVLFDDIKITPVPEPGTWALLAAGLIGLGVAKRRRQS